ncbi:GIY-YIG nuclease family protein [Rhodohalobacter barkolensis]|uniref:Excinuclease ABC subunit C n=1 Tax=Rhodohalobacter barkolensis TaxID=2053187 RepID=A0A2N0VKZ0_9BACT|nr:GIY-YIG nuclease family protein [Rhodohalobacter barkolensis]PKD44850.1 excinuclease ABC subunit C [Rhodohalobacter barkolensis]
MKYYLYILQSKVKETYYVGMSNDPDRRLHFHNTDNRKAHTSRYRPWKIAYSHPLESKKEAIAAESKVKSWKSKKMIRLLIEDVINIEDYL